MTCSFRRFRYIRSFEFHGSFLVPTFCCFCGLSYLHIAEELRPFIVDISSRNLDNRFGLSEPQFSCKMWPFLSYANLTGLLRHSNKVLDWICSYVSDGPHSITGVVAG